MKTGFISMIKDKELRTTLIKRFFNVKFRRHKISTACLHCAYFQEHVKFDINTYGFDRNIGTGCYYCLDSKQDIIDSEIKLSLSKNNISEPNICGRYFPRTRENLNLISLTLSQQAKKIALWSLIVSSLLAVASLILLNWKVIFLILCDILC